MQLEYKSTITHVSHVQRITSPITEGLLTRILESLGGPECKSHGMDRGSAPVWHEIGPMRSAAPRAVLPAWRYSEPCTGTCPSTASVQHDGASAPLSSAASVSGGPVTTAPFAAAGCQRPSFGRSRLPRCFRQMALAAAPGVWGPQCSLCNPRFACASPLLGSASGTSSPQCCGPLSPVSRRPWVRPPRGPFPAVSTLLSSPGHEERLLTTGMSHVAL